MTNLTQLFKNLARDSSAYFLATVGAKLVSMAIIPLAAYFLGAAGFAEFDAFLLCNTLLTLLLLLGVDSGSALQIISDDNNGKLENRGSPLPIMILVVVSMAILAAFLIGSSSVWSYFESLPLWHSFFYSIFAAFQTIAFTYLRFNNQPILGSLVVFLTAVASTLIGLLWLTLDPTNPIFSLLNGIVLGQMIGGIISLLLMCKPIHEQLKTVHRSNVFSLLRLSIPYVPASLAVWARKSIDRVLINHFIGDAEVLGAYALMARLAEFAQVLLGTIGSACMPQVLKNYRLESGIVFARRILYGACFVAFLGLLIAWWGSSFLLPLVDKSNGAFFMYSSLLIPLTAAGLMGSLLNFTGFGFQISGKTHIYALLIVGSVVGQAILGSFFLNLNFGLHALALCNLITTSIFILLYITQSEKLHPFNYKRLFWVLPVFLVTSLGIFASIQACSCSLAVRFLCTAT